MIYKLLNIILSLIIKRSFFILINLFTFIFSFYCLKFLFSFIHSHSNLDAALNEQMNDTLNGVAGILVALGVLMESRIVIMKMIKNEITSTEEHINEIAEHNGMGLLLIGLFMEIITLMIDVPDNLIDTRGIEIYLFYACFVFIAISMMIEIDLIKDYLKTYFKKR